MFTRRHYDKLAEAISATVVSVKASHKIAGDKEESAFREGYMTAFYSIAFMLQKDNPVFDMAEFRKACKIPD